MSNEWRDSVFNAIPKEELKAEELGRVGEEGEGHITWVFNDKQDDIKKECEFKFFWKFNEEGQLNLMCEIDERYTRNSHLFPISDEEARHIHYQSALLFKFIHNWEDTKVFFMNRWAKVNHCTPWLCNVCKEDMREHHAQCVELEWVSIYSMFGGLSNFV